MSLAFQYRYQDFLDELHSGSHFGVFVDDTGSPGMKNTPPNLHPDRKSWVGVVVPPDQMPEVLEQFPEALEEVTREIGATEFHFVDIYNGREEFEGVDLSIRLGLFGFMTHIFATYRFPIYVQTLDPNNLAELRSRAAWPEKIPPFDLRKQEDMGLLFLLMRLKSHVERHRGDAATLARVFVDEGFKDNGRAITIPTFEKAFADGLICFAKSSSILPLQLADFAAFAMNRVQLLLGKKDLSDLDKSLMQILSPIAPNFQNIETRPISFDQWTPLDRPPTPSS